ncbi:hypothetical protein V2G26_017849 [Clonostachys chloroleuca]
MQLTPKEWDQAYKKLVEGAKRIRADCELLITKNVGGDKEAASTTAKPSKDKSCSGKILIRQVPSKTEDVIETRIAVVGNVDAGKSSLLGVLVKGDLDDGRGKARVNLFRHKHEIETGRTSSRRDGNHGFRQCRSSRYVRHSRPQALMGRNRETERQGHYLH